jgi:hypothetical protein
MANAAWAGDLPPGYAGWGLSPDLHYIVAVPKLAELGNSTTARDELLDSSYHVMANIEGTVGWDQRLGDLVSGPARWASDDSFVLWAVGGKGGVATLVLIQIGDGRVLAQTDLLAAARKEILDRTRDANPRAFAEVAHGGSAKELARAFSIVVSVPGPADSPIELPLPIHAELNSNPDSVVDAPSLRSSIDAQVDPTGDLVNVNFHYGDD